MNLISIILGIFVILLTIFFIILIKDHSIEFIRLKNRLKMSFKLSEYNYLKQTLKKRIITIVWAMIIPIIGYGIGIIISVYMKSPITSTILGNINIIAYWMLIGHLILYYINSIYEIIRYIILYNKLKKIRTI